MAAQSNVVRALLIATTVALPATISAQTDTRPVVAILSFDNNSIGPGRGDFDGLGKGIQETLIADMASNPKIRLVDRERIQRVLEEQQLVKAGSIDPATSVRVGRILGAQYAIYGGFMSDGRGNMVLTAHSTDMETSALGNAVKVQRKTDDVLGLVAEMSAKLSSEIKLDPKPGRRGREGGDAGDDAKSAPIMAAPAPASKTKPTGTPSPAGPIETYAKPISPRAMKAKLDIGTMKIYSNALDEMDRKNAAKATELLKQVLSKFPDFEPAQRNLDKLSKRPRN